MASMTDIKRYAEEASRLTGVPASVIAAQAALESRYGKSAPGNNFFGVKAFRSWTGPTQNLMTTEYVNGKKVRVRQPFRKYATPLDSFVDWANVIKNNPRYADVLAAQTPEEAMQALAASGYATDPKYYSKLKSAYNKVTGPTPPANVGNAPVGGVLRRGVRGPEVARWQSYLQSMGLDVDVDGVFGRQTQEATEVFQRATGLKPDGIVGPQTQIAANELSGPASPYSPPIPRANPAFARPDLQTALNEAAAREAELRAAPRVEPVANADLNQQAFEPQGRISAALTPVERAPLADLTPTLASPRDNLAPPHIGPGPLDQAPRISAAPVGPVERSELPDITPRYASPRDNFAPPHIGPDPDPLGLERELSQSRAQMDAMRQAIDEGWSVDAARIRSGMDQPNPVPRANPLREISIGANSPLADTSLDTAPRIQARPDFDYTVGPAGAPVGGVADFRRSPDFDFAVGPANAPVNSAADLRRTPDFDFAVGPANQSAPPAAASSPAPTSFPVGNSPVGATGLPDSALRGLQMNFAPAEMSLGQFADRFDPLATAPRTELPALPSRNVGYAPGMTPLAGVPQTATPQVYQPTSPVGGPTLDEIAYGAMPPGAAAASAAPVGKKPGMISNILSNPLARAGIGYLTGGPLGAAIGLGGALLSGALKGGGFGALGGGFDPATAARNAAYAAGVSQSDMIGGRYGGASYGRTGSDGVTRGTTSSGTGWSSSNGGRDVTVGGRSYRERRDGRGYSAVL